MADEAWHEAYSTRCIARRTTLGSTTLALYSSLTHLSAIGPIYGSQYLSNPSCASLQALKAAYRVAPTEATMKRVRRKAGRGRRRLKRRRRTRSGVVSRADW